MAVGQTIALACNENPTKVIGSKKILPALQIMIDGYTKADPPAQKKLPVKKMGQWKGATFKEYIREKLVCYSAGMSLNMK
jgi:hypothetical protein